MEERRSAAVIVRDQLGQTDAFQIGPKADQDPATFVREFEQDVVDGIRENKRETKRIQSSPSTGWAARLTTLTVD